MTGSALAHYHGIAAFSETNFHEDLKKISVPVLVLHGEDDQVVPFEASGKQTVKLIKGAQLISYPGFPHGMPVTHADAINKDILKFIKS